MPESISSVISAPATADHHHAVPPWPLLTGGRVPGDTNGRPVGFICATTMEAPCEVAPRRDGGVVVRSCAPVRAPASLVENESQPQITRMILMNRAWAWIGIIAIAVAACSDDPSGPVEQARPDSLTVDARSGWAYASLFDGTLHLVSIG